ncbi:MAG: hypothetical protein Q8O61_00420 [Nocardioides sp.]|nr:hypothetical protein [Nocardioides sp.]
MRPAVATSTVALVLLAATACSGSPDLGAAEADLAGVDGVVDADAAWFDGSLKVADAAAVSVAAGADLAEADVEQLAQELITTVDGLGWEVEPNLAVELDDDADAVPFLSHFPGDDNAPPPTDISTYTVHAANLDERDLEDDLRFLLHAATVLEAPAQVAFTDEDVLEAAADVTTPAGDLTAVLERLVEDPLLSRPVRWRISGPDLLLESSAGLTPADVALWDRIASGSESLGGLARTRVDLAVEADRRLTVVRVTLRADGPASAGTRAVTEPARALSQRLDRLGVDQVDVVVEGSDEALVRAFFEGGEGRPWEPYDALE